MSLMIAFMKRTVVCLLSLVLVYVMPTLANPNNYPQFAQQEVDPTIPIFFTGVEHVKAQLDKGRPPLLIDVRTTAEYNAGHIPQARSIPLEDLSRRMAEIPRDIPVVLY